MKLFSASSNFYSFSAIFANEKYISAQMEDISLALFVN